MAYQVTLRQSAIKALQKINEPYYSHLKEAIYKIPDQPDAKN